MTQQRRHDGDMIVMVRENERESFRCLFIFWIDFSWRIKYKVFFLLPNKTQKTNIVFLHFLLGDATDGCESSFDCSSISTPSGSTCSACDYTTEGGTTCTAVKCDAGVYDSNGNPVDGCESSIDCASAITIVQGKCSACSSTSACTAVKCSNNKFDTNDDFVTDGCEAGCGVVAHGTCTACTTGETNGCTAVTCNGGKYDSNGDATDGCESSIDCTLAISIIGRGMCTACSNPTTCTAVTCDAGTLDSNNLPADGCEARCESMCDTCSDETTCTSCATDFTLTNGDCILDCENDCTECTVISTLASLSTHKPFKMESVSG